MVLGPDVLIGCSRRSSPLGQDDRIHGPACTRSSEFSSGAGKLLGLFNMDNVVVLPMNTFLERVRQETLVSLNVEARDSTKPSTARRKRSSACCGSGGA